MECPNCENIVMQETTKDIPFTYKGQTLVVENVEGKRCPSCDEFILSREASKRANVLLKEFAQKINAAEIDPQYISGVRKKLKLDQKEAGEIFGGGVNAFSRYETGKTRPPVSVVKLLKILDKHPELLSEVRQ